MKKIFSLTGFVVSILFCHAVLAQTVNKAEYFFDTDPGIGNGIAIAIPNPADSVDITGAINTTGLSAGFHRLFIRARLSNKKWSLYEGRNFYIYSPALAGNDKIKKAEYYIDNDPGVGNGINIAIGLAADSIDISSSINTTGLSAGFHKLAVRVKNQSNVWSLYEARNFYIIPPAIVTQVKIVKAEYFFDTDPGIGNGTPIATGAAADSIDISSSINTTGLSAGFHKLIVRVKNQSNVWSLYESRNFYIIPPPLVTQVKIVSAEYFFDTDPGIGNGTAISTGAANDSIAISSTINSTGLSLGFHKLFIRAKNESNVWSLYEARNFYIGDTVQASSAQIVSAEYFFDTDPGQGNGFAVSPTFSPNDSIDIISSASSAGLASGTHYMYVRVKDQLGNWSQPLGDTLYIGFVGINELANNPDITMQPNPSNGNAVLSYLLKTANAQLQINDANGKLIYQESIVGNKGTKQIDISKNGNGIFFWQIVSDNKPVSTGKMAVIK